ncbi:hypothetical protein N7466_006727 [Penicillium verhagenii]|uniref:uncharacterized protein n=1 Tax=Penicillium verhagenii TaxID=1562060 RepID=UPI002544FA9D|nr:uncharacterized protein N7466_006727 [Penicillium verhagenii]KAJ5927771.1 hypothetical protein N7466_006727 [Penicillium verhagenii]
MADSLCGPSNALQNFQKHTSVDRTLQQDRLVSRQSSSQGFRSQGPRDGILDPEFAAFEANLGGPSLSNLQHPANFGAPIQLPTAPHPNASWASDFQNLHISGPAPPQLQQHIQRPSGIQAQGGWQDEFFKHQQSQQAPATPQLLPNHQTTNHAYQPAFATGYHPMYNSSMNTTYQAPPEAHAQHVMPVEKFDESAFEAAFDQARATLELQSAEATPAPEQHMQDASPIDPFETAQENLQIGSDTILESEQQDPQTQAHDADALAQAAGQIINSVSHDQSDKFQQSNFLALMRRIRDREVEVKGEDFCETAQSLHPGGRYYPGQSPPPQDSVLESDSASKESPFLTDRV